MTHTSGAEEAGGPDGRWVALWQLAVRASVVPMGLVDLSTARFLELSPRGAELLGTTAENGVGVSYLAVVEPTRAATDAFRLVREGMIEGSQSRRRLRRPDGTAVDVQTAGWAIRSAAGADLGLWLASEMRSPTQSSVAEEVVARLLPRHSPSGEDGDRIGVDHRWQVTRVRSTTDALLGRPLDELLTCSLLDLVHPDDLPPLLFGLARATSGWSGRALARVRRQDGSWQVVEVVPTIHADGVGEDVLATFVLTERSADDGGAAPGSGVRDVPERLRRIADQIEAANVLAPLADVGAALGIATTADLSPRQWEIVSRLVRGDRVATIAADMFLSRSTVRNHLSAIFTKVGVHSQDELLALFRDGRRPDPSAT